LLILRLTHSGLRRGSLFFSRLLGARRQNGVQGVAFLPRPEFHDSAIADIFNQPLQNLPSQPGAGHFSATEKNRGLYLVAFIQETEHVVLFGLVVVIVHVDAELHFFDRDGFLVLLGFAVFFLLLIKKLPVIHDAANRRLRGGRYLYQIQVLFAGHFERFKGGQNADLLAFIANHANFSRANALVCADKTFVDTNLRKLSNVGFKIIACGAGSGLQPAFRSGGRLACSFLLTSASTVCKTSSSLMEVESITVASCAGTSGELARVRSRRSRSRNSAAMDSLEDPCVGC